MTRRELERLRDIRDAIAAIRAHIARGEVGDPLLHDALLYQFVVIGEAVKSLTPEARETAPGVPWESISGLRDLIAHEYFRIDFARILDVVDNHLPALEEAVDRLLEGR